MKIVRRLVEFCRFTFCALHNSAYQLHYGKDHPTSGHPTLWFVIVREIKHTINMQLLIGDEYTEISFKDLLAFSDNSVTELYIKAFFFVLF